MAITLATLRERICREMGTWKEVTTTSAGASDGTTLISTEFADYDDGTLEDKYVKTTSGSTKETRQIKDNLSPTGTIIPKRVFSAQIATSITVELHDFDPDDLPTLINNVVKDAYPYIAKPVVDTTLVSGNILPNSNFEEWTLTTYPDYWRTSVSTLTEETSTVLFGSSSLKVVNAGYAYLSSAQWLSLLDLEDKGVSVYVWCKCDTADAAKLQIYTKEQDGTEQVLGGTGDALHSGGDEWELLELENQSIPDDLAEIQIRLTVAGANTAYFDNCHLGASTDEYLIPSTLDTILAVHECNDCDKREINNWKDVDWHIVDKEGTKYLRIYDTINNRHLELIGFQRFDALSSDTDSLAITEQQENVIIWGTIANLLRSRGTIISSEDIKEVNALADKYQAKFEAGKIRYSKSIAPLQFKRWGS